MSDKIREALAGMLVIVDESRGVDGYHLSGDIAEWDTFPEVAAARAALAQQPTQAVPDGWKLVPVRATREQVNAVCMHPDLARTLYRNMVEAAPAAPAPAAQEPVAWQARFTDPGQQWGDCTKEHHDFVKANPGEWSGYEVRELFATPPAAEQLDHSGDSADMVWCACGDGYPADTHDAGFIHGSGMCQNCDAAIPAKDIQADADDLVVWRITLPGGESCHFGTESMAKAWGRGSGKVERIDLKARPALELVAAEQPDIVKVPRELLNEVADEITHLDRQWRGDDAMGLRMTPPRVSRLMDKLRALLGKESEDHE